MPLHPEAGKAVRGESQLRAHPMRILNALPHPILAVGAIGLIPGLKGPSRLLMGLVITVLIVNNYQKLIKGFQNAWQKPPQAVAGPKTDAPAATSAPDFITGFLQSNPFGNSLEAPQ